MRCRVAEGHTGQPHTHFYFTLDKRDACSILVEKTMRMRPFCSIPDPRAVGRPLSPSGGEQEGPAVCKWVMGEIRRSGWSTVYPASRSGRGRDVAMEDESINLGVRNNNGKGVWSSVNGSNTDSNFIYFFVM